MLLLAVPGAAHCLSAHQSQPLDTLRERISCCVRYNVPKSLSRDLGLVVQGSRHSRVF